MRALSVSLPPKTIRRTKQTYLLPTRAERTQGSVLAQLHTDLNKFIDTEEIVLNACLLCWENLYTVLHCRVGAMRTYISLLPVTTVSKAYDTIWDAFGVQNQHICEKLNLNPNRIYFRRAHSCQSAKTYLLWEVEMPDTIYQPVCAQAHHTPSCSARIWTPTITACFVWLVLSVVLYDIHRSVKTRLLSAVKVFSRRSRVSRCLIPSLSLSLSLYIYIYICNSQACALMLTVLSIMMSPTLTYTKL